MDLRRPVKSEVPAGLGTDGRMLGRQNGGRDVWGTDAMTGPRDGSADR